jgi:hypothetical protein
MSKGLLQNFPGLSLRWATVTCLVMYVLNSEGRKGQKMECIAGKITRPPTYKETMPSVNSVIRRTLGMRQNTQNQELHKISTFLQIC